MARGIRVAALHCIPLIAVYATWYVAFGRTDKRSTLHDLSLIGGAQYLWDGCYAAAADLGQLRGLGVLYAISLAAGIVMACRVGRCQAAQAAGCLAGGVAFAATTAIARSVPFAGSRFVGARNGGVVPAGTSRYVYVMVALALPLIALGAGALMRHWRLAIVISSVALTISFVGNSREFAHGRDGSRFGTFTADAARNPLLSDLPRSFRLAGPFLPIPVGWLEDAAAQKLPEAPRLNARSTSTVALRILAAHATIARPTECRTLRPMYVSVDPGHALAFEDGVGTAEYAPIGGARSEPISLHTFAIPNPARIPLRFWVSPVDATRVCTGPARPGPTSRR
jgi:hypothetical protein